MTRNGTILRLDAERGFGFIGTDDGQRNIFFHVRDFRGGMPAQGLAVSFEQIAVGGKGPRAMAVQALGRPAPTPQAEGQRRRNKRDPSRAPSRESPQRNREANAPSGRSRQARGDSTGAGHPLLFGAALVAWLGLLGAVTARGLWPASTPWVLAALLLLNAATFVTYAIDKSAARRGQWRTAESTLHALALAGGWPAAWLAQRVLRHKSRKAEFLLVYGVTVLLNLGALGAWLWRGGA